MARKKAEQKTADSVLKARGPGPFLFHLDVTSAEARHFAMTGLTDEEMAKLFARLFSCVKSISIDRSTCHLGYTLNIVSDVPEPLTPELFAVPKPDAAMLRLYKRMDAHVHGKGRASVSKKEAMLIAGLLVDRGV